MTDERFTEAVRNKEALTALIASEGWAIFDKVLVEKEQHMLAVYLDPAQELSDITLREYRMALISLRATSGIPGAMLEDAQLVIDEFADVDTEEEEDNSNGEEEYAATID